MAGKIFVNYRRDDSASHALNVAQYLEREFGAANVFLDIDRMRAGERFPKVLEERLNVSKVMLVVIGPSWLTVANEAGLRRLDDPEDWVRLEIARALQRGIPVIPVLVGGAGLPRKADLPDDLMPLVEHQVATLTTNGFRHEMAGLARDIRALLGPRRRGALAAAAGGAVLAVALAMSVGVLPMFGLASLFGPSKMVSDPPGQTSDGKQNADAAGEAKRKADEGETKRKADEAAAAAETERQRLAALAAEEERKRKEAEAEAARLRAEAEAKRKADEAAAAEAKRLADEADAKRKEEQRLAMQAEEKKKQEAEEAMKPGRTFRDCEDVCPEMVVVPAGSFTMGSPESEAGRRSDEGPQHKVTTAKPFAVGKLEVTRDEFEAFVTATNFKVADECLVFKVIEWKQTGSFRKPGFEQTGKHPAVCVSWEDAKAYADWLSKKTGKSYRLLTEAEWEYAARAGTTGRWSFTGDEAELCTYANYADRSVSFSWKNTKCSDGVGERTAEAGRYKANPFGLFDMHGNVWEWVEDCYQDSYNGAPTDGSARTSGDCSRRVFRGGSWYYVPDYLRSANRGRYTADGRGGNLGFRVGRTLTP